MQIRSLFICMSASLKHHNKAFTAPTVPATTVKPPVGSKPSLNCFKISKNKAAGGALPEPWLGQRLCRGAPQLHAGVFATCGASRVMMISRMPCQSRAYLNTHQALPMQTTICESIAEPCVLRCWQCWVPSTFCQWQLARTISRTGGH